MIITEEKLEAAIATLQASDDDCANLRVEVSRKEYLCKVARARVFLTSTGSVENRKALAETHQSVQDAEEARLTALGEYEKIKAKRETNVLICEVWRSENANRRAGNI